MILVTGGAGFIGSHAVIELIENNFEVIVIDDFSNGKRESINRIKEIVGKDFLFYKGDIKDESFLTDIFNKHKIEAVMHFAGLKSVSESIEFPLKYYQNNVHGTLNLIKVMGNYNVKKLVFSSSATVYGRPKKVPISENFSLRATNPYGRTKLIMEDILEDVFASDPSWRIAILRYFNPIGAHESGEIGENPEGIPNNIMPYITQVAIGKLDMLKIFGDDYNTKDGTGVRDYIHIDDLVKGHIKALKFLNCNEGLEIFNLGTGIGYSVLELINSFKEATSKDVPFQVVERREGDVDICYANPEKALRVLGWKAQKGLLEMCKDSWNWQVKNPNGFDLISKTTRL